MLIHIAMASTGISTYDQSGIEPKPTPAICSTRAFDNSLAFAIRLWAKAGRSISGSPAARSVYRGMLRFAIVVMLLSWVVTGCAETPQQRARRLEPLLSAAGFHMAPADTPQRQQELASHTPLKMRYYFANGRPHYWFADPYLCDCVFVGREAEYQKYQQLKLQQQMVGQEQAAAAMNENAAEAEQFNWMMWPPSPYFY
jgi:hypothetical protein